MAPMILHALIEADMPHGAHLFDLHTIGQYQWRTTNTFHGMASYIYALR